MDPQRANKGDLVGIAFQDVDSEVYCVVVGSSAEYGNRFDLGSRIKLNNAVELRPPIECSGGNLPNTVSWRNPYSFKIDERKVILVGPEAITEFLTKTPPFNYYSGLGFK